MNKSRTKAVILSKSIPPFFLALLTLVFFWKILLTNLILVGVDVFLYFYPYRAYATESLLSGRLPLWNPHLFLGVPFLANSQAGLLYPFNWIFLWADVPKQIAYSIGLHIWLAGIGAYYFAHHSLRLPSLAAFVGAMIFAFSGFLGAQVEHINQLQVSAWLPWTFLFFDKISEVNKDLKIWKAKKCIAFLGLFIAFMLLAGHTQSVYISLVGLSVYALARRGLPFLFQNATSGGQKLHFFFIWGLDRLRHLIPLMAAVLLAILISAAQLLPTFELSQHSFRSGGLTYNEVVSFSLNPHKLFYTIFPPYGLDLEAQLGPAFSEFIAYIGLIPLALALTGAISLWRSRQQDQGAIGLVGGVGFILAFGLFTGPLYILLYHYVPGFNLFRVPARWLLLYTFAMAMLAAIGFHCLGKHVTRATWRIRGFNVTLISLIIVELFIAAQSLRYNKPTAPEAYHFLQPAIVQLQTAQKQTDRFFSLSGTRYDPGDLREVYNIYSDQLSERAIYDYLVAAKQKEVLFFNLPLVFGLNTIDGYDGGLLPLKKFLDLQRLFLDEETLSSDGRLREKLQTLPPTRLLSFLGVRHIITDKVHDIWLDNIFYDLQFPAILKPREVSQVWTENIPPLSTTAIGVIFQSQRKDEVADLIVRYEDGREVYFAISLDQSQAWTENDYYTVFDGLSGQPIHAVGVVAKDDITIRGLSLINQASLTSQSLILSTEGQYRLIHGGDIKIYESLTALPRAFIVQERQTVTNTNAAIRQLRDPNFDLSQTFVQVSNDSKLIRGNLSPPSGTPSVGGAPAGGLEGPPPLASRENDSQNQATITHYSPEKVTIQTYLNRPGWLILTDTHYPGWRVWVDGVEIEILEANLMFRAVALSAGVHEVFFAYQPNDFYWGLGFSLFGLLIFVILIFYQK